MALARRYSSSRRWSEPLLRIQVRMRSGASSEPARRGASTRPTASGSLTVVEGAAAAAGGAFASRRIENLGTFALGRRAVGIQDELLIAVVYRLQRRPRLNVDESAKGDILPLRRFAEVHRQRSG